MKRREIKNDKMKRAGTESTLRAKKKLHRGQEKEEHGKNECMTGVLFE